MIRHLLWFLVTPALGLGVAVEPVAAQGSPKEEAAIAKSAEAFIDAFHKGNAKALAAFWTSDGDYTDQSGKNLKGRDAIEKTFTGFFSEHKGAKLRIDSHALRFVTPEVAVEDGVTAVIPADGGAPSQARYTIVHVKKDGHWLLSSVRDSPYVPQGNYEHLRGLEWAMGDWASDGDKGTVERLSVAWAENQNFINATFMATVNNVSVGSAKQWIGWDPVDKRVRSWVFDSTGGFGEGTLSQVGKNWVIKTKSVLQDGKKATGTLIVGPVDADTITFQSTDRSVDGVAVPDGKEIKLKRMK
ncbi:MAG: SgcJ/EcaC family oxidoreductase [Planctomycetes bacterium]|nr:SgcJ/EcaC family oxidoreductase [Planctomycetota bacterium]